MKPKRGINKERSTMELAEDELKNMAKVWASVLVSLSYCYSVGKLTQPGIRRLLAILPIVALFLVLPLKLTSFTICGFTSFFIAWLANFKLLLFAFGQPPLCSQSSLSFPHFIALASFPIKIQPHKSKTGTDPDLNLPNPSKPSNTAWYYIIKVVLHLLLIPIYAYSDSLHPKLLWLIYLVHIYLSLEIGLALVAGSANLFLGCELEPQFKEPLLSTSLQDFWGRRWNIMVTRILRPTVYLPVLDSSGRIVGRRWAPLPAVMATFLVSALMHELIFYYLGRLRPTFEVTGFFVLHGFSLCVEIVIKKALEGRKWRFPAWVSGPATAVYVVATGFWLFMPPLLRAGLVTKTFEEYTALRRFVSSNFLL